MSINWDASPTFDTLRAIVVRGAGSEAGPFFKVEQVADHYTDIAVIEELLAEHGQPAEDGENTTPGFYLPSDKAGAMRQAFLAREEEIYDTWTMRFSDLLLKAETEGLDMFLGQAS